MKTILAKDDTIKFKILIHIVKNVVLFYVLFHPFTFLVLATTPSRCSDVRVTLTSYYSVIHTEYLYTDTTSAFIDSCITCYSLDA